MGKLKGTKSDGYILIDVLVGLTILSIGFASIFFGIRIAGRETARQYERVRNNIAERNERALLPRVFSLEE